MKHKVAKSCTHIQTQVHVRYSPISYHIDVLPCCLAFEWFNTLYCKVHLLSDSFCQGGFLNILLMIPPPISARELWAWCPHAYLPSQPLQQHLWCSRHIEPGGERWRETLNVEYKRVEIKNNGASADEKHTQVFHWEALMMEECDKWKGARVVMRRGCLSWWRW